MILRRRAVAVVVVLACSASARARADNQICNDSYEQGQVLRKDHKLLEAREQLRTCVNTCSLEAKKRACSDWLAALDHDIPTIVVSAKDGSGAALVAVTVTMDGKPFAASLNGKAMEVNPDLHTFAFQAADGTRVEQQVVVAEGEKDKPVAVTLAKPPAPPEETKVPNAGGAVTGSSTGATAAPSSPPQNQPARTSSGPWRTIGVVTAGAGVVGLGLGAVFGLQALSKKSGAGCYSNSVCSDIPAANMLRDAKSSGDLATIFFVAGGALSGGGLLLWALGPSGTVQATPTVGSRTAGLLLRGVW